MQSRLLISLLGCALLLFFATGLYPPTTIVAGAPSSLSIQIRRDTSLGLPAGSAHSAGISSIVQGQAIPGSAVVLTLHQLTNGTVTRATKADQNGNFVVSMDRLIADGESIDVSSGAMTRTVQVPMIHFQVDAEHKMITGTGPADIVNTTPGAPHSLAIAFGSSARTQQVTTSSAGTFAADFSTNPFQPGELGALHYITSEGDSIFKPLFAADPFARGQAGDGWADTILGQPDFAQTTFNEVVGNRLFNPGGVYVDRSVQPNRVYVYDSGNSRILGFSSLGVTASGQPCTSLSDYGSTCYIQANRAADIILGQSSATTSTCNGDSAYQSYPDVPMASAATLCGQREDQLSISEGGSGATMITDAQGNLYVPDFYNNRILRYNSPFTTDTVADYVWGQADFSGSTCNRGASIDHANADGLCLAAPPGYGDLRAGVALDTAGNLWVADNENNRVLRFPFSATRGVADQTPDLVLGQPDFSTASYGSGLNKMDKPASVRVTNNGTVYIADGVNNRVLVFSPPFTNGMNATRLLGSELLSPQGLEIDPSGSVWVDDSGNHRFLQFVNEVQKEVVPGDEGRAWGGIGIDREGSLMWAGWDQQQVLHFSKQGSATNHTQDAVFLQSETGGIFNQTGQHGLYGGKGLEVTTDQLIYADGSRILFWNNPQSLSNYQSPSGIVGAADYHSRLRYGPWYERLRADKRGHLWALNGDLGTSTLYGFNLPLTTGAVAAFTFTSPLPLQGGGNFSWTGSLYLGGIDVQPNCDCLWLSDEENHRAFRIQNITTQPVVDIVLGQVDNAGMACNQGRGRDYPTRTSLCHPGALGFDHSGNLFLADHNVEFDGNLRLLEYDATSLPSSPTTALFAIPATRVFGRNGSFTAPTCLSFADDPMCAPWEPTFNSRGEMAIGFNPYFGSRFPVIYQNPLINALPVAALGDFQSMPTSARYDQFDNLYVLDHNRSRILIYYDKTHQPQVTPTTIPTTVPMPTTPLPTSTATPATPTNTVINTPVPTTKPLPTLVSSPTAVPGVQHIHLYLPITTHSNSTRAEQREPL